MELEKMFNINIIKKNEEIPDIIGKIDLSRDVIFSFPTDSKEIMEFDYSGVIRVGLSEDINLSTIPNKMNQNLPIRVHRTRPNMKFCCPSGIAPIFLKPSSAKSILSITATYQNFIDVKLEYKKIQKSRKQKPNTSVIYQNIDIEMTFNKDILLTEYPSMILPQNFKIFDLLLSQTIFSDTLTIGEVYVIYGTEFFNTFKEAI